MAVAASHKLTVTPCSACVSETARGLPAGPENKAFRRVRQGEDVAGEGWDEAAGRSVAKRRRRSRLLHALVGQHMLWTAFAFLGLFAPRPTPVEALVDSKETSQSRASPDEGKQHNDEHDAA